MVLSQWKNEMSKTSVTDLLRNTLKGAGQILLQNVSWGPSVQTLLLLDGLATWNSDYSHLILNAQFEIVG